MHTWRGVPCRAKYVNYLTQNLYMKFYLLISFDKPSVHFTSIILFVLFLSGWTIFSNILSFFFFFFGYYYQGGKFAVSIKNKMCLGFA